MPKCLRRSKAICSKVCEETVCKKLEECMVKYMKKQLAHEDDDSEEFKAVKQQLKDQILIHNPSENEKRRRATRNDAVHPHHASQVP